MKDLGEIRIAFRYLLSHIHTRFKTTIQVLEKMKSWPIRRQVGINVDFPNRRVALYLQH